MKLLSSIFFFVLLSFSCSDKDIQYENHDKPEKPTVIGTQEIPGGALISYSLSDNKGVLAVKCVYTLSNGKKYETLSSFYNNTVKIEGFMDTAVHEVMLYAISRGKVLSDPVTVQIKPLEAPITKVVKSMQIDKDFGGAQFSWDNLDKANLSMEFITPDSTGVMRGARIISTSGIRGTFSLRGYESKPRRFGVLIRDFFDNVSDTIYPIDKLTGQKVDITPIFEKKLDKKKIIILGLENDSPWNAFGTAERDLLDDDINSIGHTPQNAIPALLTLDLGTVAKLSRIVIHQRRYDGHFYNWGNPMMFDIFKSNNTPTRSGSWSDWALIKSYEILKPSGLPVNQESEEDIIEALNGHNFSFPLELAPSRYLRLRFNKTWGALPAVHIAELTLYGDDGTGNQ